MHDEMGRPTGPRCIELVGNMPTVVLPSPGDLRNVPSGAAQNAGVTIPMGGCLVVMAPTADVLVTIPNPAGIAIYIIPCARGLTRIILPPSLETGPVTGTSLDVWQCWTENLSAMRKEF